jgi:hypothetical protein
VPREYRQTFILIANCRLEELVRVYFARLQRQKTPSATSAALPSPPSKTSTRPSSSSLAEFLPASLRTTTRYGKEPQIMSSSSGHRRVGIGNVDSPTQPRRPRRRQKPEDVRRDAETQCSPPPPPPPPPVVVDAATQTVAKKTANRETATDVKQTCDTAAQVKVEMRNRMVETSATVVEYPQIDYSSGKSSR